ncbi:MAG: type II toxin-antitoxin system VapB family antitoxin [Leptospiraceae bacterium]|nr:type II toxin-antitoxin system VapB family antitoxin [Leptospiraceae bacterium]
MATNLDLNIDLLEQAFALSGLKTKKETVNFALKEFIQRRKQKEILKFIGKVEFDPNYDFKAKRSRKKIA